MLYNYLLSVVIAALICSLLSAFLPKNSTYRGILRILCGIFLSITVITPVWKLSANRFFAYAQDIQEDGQEAISYGLSAANEYRNSIIKQKLEAYILDKAESMGASLSIEVILDDKNQGLPQSVKLYGNVAPLSRIRLAEIIQNELGIPQEDQEWIG